MRTIVPSSCYLRTGAPRRSLFVFCAAGGSAPFVFIGTRTFSGSAGELHYKLIDANGTANDKTVIEADLNGDSRADFAIDLSRLVALSSKDFVL